MLKREDFSSVEDYVEALENRIKDVETENEALTGRDKISVVKKKLYDLRMYFITNSNRAYSYKMNLFLLAMSNKIDLFDSNSINKNPNVILHILKGYVGLYFSDFRELDQNNVELSFTFNRRTKSDYGPISYEYEDYDFLEQLEEIKIELDLSTLPSRDIELCISEIDEILKTKVKDLSYYPSLIMWLLKENKAIISDGFNEAEDYLNIVESSEV